MSIKTESSIPASGSSEGSPKGDAGEPSPSKNKGYGSPSLPPVTITVVVNLNGTPESFTFDIASLELKDSSGASVGPAGGFVGRFLHEHTFYELPDASTAGGAGGMSSPHPPRNSSSGLSSTARAFTSPLFKPTPSQAFPDTGVPASLLDSCMEVSSDGRSLVPQVFFQDRMNMLLWDAHTSQGILKNVPKNASAKDLHGLASGKAYHTFARDVISTLRFLGVFPLEEVFLDCFKYSFFDKYYPGTFTYKFLMYISHFLDTAGQAVKAQLVNPQCGLELWRRLFARANGGTNRLAHFQQLIVRMTGLNWSSSQPFEFFYQKVVQLALDLETALDFALPSWFVSCMIIHGLPDSHSTVRNTILTTQGKDLDPLSILNMINESVVTTTKSTPSVLAVTPERNRVVLHFKCGTVHDIDDLTACPNKPEDVHCKTCESKGHITAMHTAWAQSRSHIKKKGEAKKAKKTTEKNTVNAVIHNDLLDD